MNNIGTPPNYPRKYPLAIEDSGSNIHLENQAIETMSPLIMSKEMVERILDGSTMESSHEATIQIPGLTKKSIQIQILPKMRTSPLIPLGFLCDYGCAITLEQQEMTSEKNGQQILISYQELKKQEFGNFPWKHNNQTLW